VCVCVCVCVWVGVGGRGGGGGRGRGGGQAFPCAKYVFAVFVIYLSFYLHHMFLLRLRRVVLSIKLDELLLSDTRLVAALTPVGCSDQTSEESVEHMLS
jgi:hypothetical protein